MTDINFRVSQNAADNCWDVISYGFSFTASWLDVRNPNEGYLVIFIDDSGNEPYYRVRTTRHLATHQHRMGFRWVHESVTFTADGEVIVDGRPYRPNN